MRERETEHTMSHHVRLAGKLAKRLGLVRARARDVKRKLEALQELQLQMQQDLSELAHEVRVLREANRCLGELLDKREAPRPSNVESGFPAGTIGW